ncbi:MAG: glycine--tRNA ligase [Phycisphaerae bacterium]|nr:glycine--tRNA ligase [Phycisphaerae bacterium]
MEKLVALCRRRGFIFQSSEIYGGINGFWDYGPLGVELKRNLKDAWWRDIVRCPPDGPDGKPIDMVGLDCTIIMNRRVWEASGHATGFSDPMSMCKFCKKLFRSDHIPELLQASPWVVSFKEAAMKAAGEQPTLDSAAAMHWAGGKGKKLAPGLTFVHRAPATMAALTEALQKEPSLAASLPTTLQYLASEHPAATGLQMPCPECGGVLTEPRQFNLMFQTHTGAVQDDASMTYLRPETAQGIFANFRNVTDTSRVKIPFGIAQIGKAFRNEVTPRNFTFRSREFEQMEIEFFIRPDTAAEWYKFWRDTRFQWWQSIGLAGTNLQLREHDRDELAHYAKEGAGTSDIEYKFPFTDPGFGELEGVAHRTDFDLRQHAEFSGLGDKLKYFDQEKNERYFPHVIEPSAGADRGTLALLCEAYTDDPGRPSGVVMKFHPRMAPIKAAIFPLVDKDGMAEIATKLYADLRKTWNVQLDIKQNIGKRYARMDEAGTPYCFTIDTQTLSDQTLTVRFRDTLEQQRLHISQVRAFLSDKIGDL